MEHNYCFQLKGLEIFNDKEILGKDKKITNPFKIRALKIGRKMNEIWKKMFIDHPINLKCHDENGDKVNKDKVDKNKTTNYEDMDFGTRDYGRKHAEKIMKDLRQRRDEITIELCALKNLISKLDEIDKKDDKSE